MCTPALAGLLWNSILTSSLRFLLRELCFIVEKYLNVKITSKFYFLSFLLITFFIFLHRCIIYIHTKFWSKKWLIFFKKFNFYWQISDFFNISLLSLRPAAILLLSFNIEILIAVFMSGIWIYNCQESGFIFVRNLDLYLSGI